MISLSRSLAIRGTWAPFCFDDDDLLKIPELDRTEELLGWRLAGLVALAMRVLDAIKLLAGTIALFCELPVPLLDDRFSGG